MFKGRRLPDARRLLTRTIVVIEEEKVCPKPSDNEVAIYCIVSINENKDSLER